MSDECIAEKARIRELLRKRRERIPEAVRKKWSQRVSNNLFRLPEFRGARTIALFGSFRSEVFTWDMIQKALSQKKRVCLPVTLKKPKRLVFKQIHDLKKDLVVGTFGIPEPTSEGLPTIDEKEIELVVAPAIAFDCLGNRIGFGGGYYDRLFAQLRPECLKVGITFHFQLVDKIPCEPTDLPVDMIVTDQTIIRCYELKDELTQTN